ncbi:hypothetical protein K1719_020149 [Acacia pycnantha]|nr:hypothetical protein K1719_020149 [Acacia pycnantha]
MKIGVVSAAGSNSDSFRGYIDPIVPLRQPRCGVGIEDKLCLLTPLISFSIAQRRKLCRLFLERDLTSSRADSTHRPSMVDREGSYTNRYEVIRLFRSYNYAAADDF